MRLFIAILALLLILGCNVALIIGKDNNVEQQAESRNHADSLKIEPIKKIKSLPVPIGGE